MQGLLEGMIGMILNDYQLRTDLSDALQNYERENNCSPILVIENLLEKFLYDEGYITVGEEEVVCKTPFEIEAERRSKFTVISKGKKSKQIRYGDVDFGYFSANEIDNVIDELLGFSDEQLKELDRGSWKYDKSKYKSYFRAKLDNPYLSVEDFLNNTRINVSVYRSGKTHISFKGNTICLFNHSKVKGDVIDSVYDFLNGLSDEELLELIRLKDESDLVSADFVLDYMNAFKKPYVLFTDSGMVMFQRKGYTFGTHNREDLDVIWEFLDSVGWDKSYSTKVTGLKGQDYKDWLYAKIGL